MMIEGIHSMMIDRRIKNGFQTLSSLDLKQLKFLNNEIAEKKMIISHTFPFNTIQKCAF